MPEKGNVMLTTDARQLSLGVPLYVVGRPVTVEVVKPATLWVPQSVDVFALNDKLTSVIALLSGAKTDALRVEAKAALAKLAAPILRKALRLISLLLKSTFLSERPESEAWTAMLSGALERAASRGKIGRS